VQQAVRDAQKALASAGIDINSAGNGFWATAGHNGTHTDAYLKALGASLNEAVRTGTVRETLNAIRLQAIAGAFKKK
jgi:hypothetical protein